MNKMNHWPAGIWQSLNILKSEPAGCRGKNNPALPAPDEEVDPAKRNTKIANLFKGRQPAELISTFDYAEAAVVGNRSPLSASDDELLDS